MTNLTDSQIVEDILGTLNHAGYAADRRNLSHVLALITSDLRGMKEAAALARRYLEDPFKIQIDKNCNYQSAFEAALRAIRDESAQPDHPT